MKRIRIVGVCLGLIFTAHLLFCGEKVVTNNFDVDPNLEITKLPEGQPFIEAVLPLPPTGGKDFVMEFDLNIVRFNHYASVEIGIKESATERRSYISLSKADDGIPRCRFITSLGPGFSFETKKPFEGEVTEDKYRMGYNALKRSIQWTVTDTQGEVVYSSEPIKLAGAFQADQIWFRVITSSKDWKGTDLSEIYYDPEGKYILVRSHIYTEGTYPYLVECNFDNLTVRYLD